MNQQPLPTTEQDTTALILPNDATPMVLLGRAVQAGQSVEVVDRLMGLYERWEANQARKAFDAALADAKAEMPIVLKTRQVGFESKKPGASRTSYKHEDLAEIVSKITPVLSKYGLYHRFRVSSEPNEPVTVTCVIGHRAGYFEETTLRAGRDDSASNMNALQRIGSTITYLQRYTLKAALGLAAAEDDDALAVTDTGPPITAEQAATLREAMEAAGITTGQFNKRFQIEGLSSLPAQLYQEALDSIAIYKANQQTKS